MDKKNNQKNISASAVLEDVVNNNNTADNITFHELKVAFHERGFGLLMVIFILPLSIPFPYPPGFTTIMVVPVFLFSLQMALGMDSPWLPKWVERQAIKRSTLAKVIEKASPALKKVERLLRPRLYFVSTRGGEKIMGIFCIVFSLSIAIPVPLTNLLPGLGIMIMALGLLSKDGITIIIGMATGSVGVFFTALILFYGSKAVFGLFPWLLHVY